MTRSTAKSNRNCRRNETKQEGLYMGACNLSIDITNMAIKIRDLLKESNHSQWKDVDYFLSQYDYKNIYDKEELIRSMLCVCHVRAYGDLYVSGIEYADWINMLGVFSGLLREHQSKLCDEMSKITFEKFAFDGKEFDVKRDVFNWVSVKNHADAMIFHTAICAADATNKPLSQSQI